jgi:hypothetical protein
VLARQHLGYDHTDATTIERVLADSNEMATLAEELDDPLLLFEAYGNRFTAAMWVGDRASGDRDLAAMEELADRLRQPALEARARTLRCATILLSGALDDAERAIGELSEYQEQHGLGPGGVPLLMYRLYFERGRLGELEPLIAGMVEAQPTIPGWRVLLTGIYTNIDRLDDARTQLRVLALDDFAAVQRNNVWVATMAGIARTAAVVGALDLAEWALDAILPFAHVVAGTGQSFEQPVGMSLGTAAAALGRWELAEELFTKALDLSERLGAPTFVAVTRVAWATALSDRGEPGDAERAREMATLALATAEELGLGRVAELSRRVLG